MVSIVILNQFINPGMFVYQHFFVFAPIRVPEVSV